MTYMTFGIGDRVEVRMKIHHPDGTSTKVHIPRAQFGALTSDGYESSFEIGGITEMTVTKKTKETA